MTERDVKERKGDTVMAEETAEFVSVVGTESGYQINGEYPFISDVKSFDHAFEISMKYSPPQATMVNIHLIADATVNDVLNFSVEVSDENVRHIFSARECGNGFLTLGGGSSEENRNRSLQVMMAPSITSLLVSEPDGSVHFLTAPPGMSVFGVSKQEYEPGQFIPEWCWYGIVEDKDICSEIE